MLRMIEDVVVIARNVRLVVTQLHKCLQSVLFNNNEVEETGSNPAGCILYEVILIIVETFLLLRRHLRDSFTLKSFAIKGPQQ